MTPYAHLILLGGEEDGATFLEFATEDEYHQWLRTRDNVG